jgi:hypothetical protein
MTVLLTQTASPAAVEVDVSLLLCVPVMLMPAVAARTVRTLYLMLAVTRPDQDKLVCAQAVVLQHMTKPCCARWYVFDAVGAVMLSS